MGAVALRGASNGVEENMGAVTLIENGANSGESAITITLYKNSFFCIVSNIAPRPQSVGSSAPQHANGRVCTSQLDSDPRNGYTLKRQLIFGQI